VARRGLLRCRRSGASNDPLVEFWLALPFPFSSSSSPLPSCLDSRGDEAEEEAAADSLAGMVRVRSGVGVAPGEVMGVGALARLSDWAVETLAALMALLLEARLLPLPLRSNPAMVTVMAAAVASCLTVGPCASLALLTCAACAVCVGAGVEAVLGETPRQADAEVHALADWWGMRGGNRAPERRKWEGRVDEGR